MVMSMFLLPPLRSVVRSVWWDAAQVAASTLEEGTTRGGPSNVV
jgi:hypothetical protein